MRIAITRRISPKIGECELTHLSRLPIDVALAERQHLAYEKRLAALGCEVHSLPPEPELPDSVFVEDAAVVLDEVAIITRPGAESRRPEVASIATALRRHRQLFFIDAPANLDGGDVLSVGRQIFIGLSGRSNRAAVQQMGEILAPFSYTVEPVEVKGCLHLKSAVSQVGDRTLLINPNWVDPGAFKTMDLIDVAAAEPFAANALLIGNTIVYPSAFPETRRRLQRYGISIDLVDVSELAKAEGAVTCCSLVFEADSPNTLG